MLKIRYIMFYIRRDSRTSGTIKALLAIAFGVLLISTDINIMAWIVQIIAAVMMVMGILPLIMVFRNPSLLPFAGGALYRVVIAVLLFMLAGPIGGIIRYILGIILIFFGVTKGLSVWNIGSRNQRQHNYDQFEDNSIDEQ